MKVIGFCGLPGSGKSTALEAISDIGKIVTMGDVIRKEAEKRGISPSSENLGKIAKEFREKGGQGIIAKKCVELINNLDYDIIFIDGLRSISEVKEFRKSWRFPVVAIDIPKKMRYRLLFERGRSDDPKSQREIELRDKRESKFGIKKVIKKADYTIKNNATIDELKVKTRKIALEIIEN